MRLTHAIPAGVLRLLFLTGGAALLLAAGEVPQTPLAASDTEVTVPALDTPEISALVAAEDDTKPAPTGPVTLAALVNDMHATADTRADREFGCLAAAVFFEARGEPLEGQLAVAQAILNRVQSGRYGDSVCAVLRAPGQFSFNAARRPAAGDDWNAARGIAAVAIAGMWHDVADGATSFHAARVRPGWHMVRVAQIGNHVFYR